MAADRRGGLLRFAPGLTLFLFLGPVAAGLAGTLLPAFGYFPALGGDGFSLDAWARFAAYPGVAAAVLRSFLIGVCAAVLSLAIVLGFFAAFHETGWFRALRRVLSPLLSVPHAAIAIGMLFLLAPSGWIVRLISPWATGWTRPPDLALAPDPDGLVLALAIVVKEVPFLFLMLLGALGQVRVAQSLTVARSLGYDKTAAWLKTVLPQVYGQIRLPFFAALAFSVSVVDMALILTPSTAPTLGILILRWFNDPDLQYQFLAAAGATVQFGLVLLAIGLWTAAEALAKVLGRLWIARAARRGGWAIPALGAVGMAVVATLGLLAPLCLAIWSMTHRWRFPDALPGDWGPAVWMRHWDGLSGPTVTTLIVAAAAAFLALVLVTACLEAEQRLGKRPTARVLWLLYAPLLIPQAAFLFGAQVLLVHSGLGGGWTAVIWAHLLFVIPYVFLSLSDPYRALDPRYARTAACLGTGGARIFWRIKLPMLSRAMLIALALGFAVSVAEYLPTVFAGGGRLATLTTEAVSLAGGGDRRVIGAFALLQAALPFVAFSLAILLPRWLFRNRRAMLAGY